MSELVNLLREFGFPVVIAFILLYDKLKTNNSLKSVVENNTQILREIKDKLERGYHYGRK